MNLDTTAYRRPIASAIRRPTWRFMASHPAHWIALGFGSGLSRVAPGTVGTLWGWLTFSIIEAYAAAAEHPLLWPLLLGASLVIGWWACTLTARHMGVADPGSVVWDEIVAIWIILWLVTPAGLWAQTVAFALFRLFDAVKPGPVAWADGLFKQRRDQPIGWRQGFGILFDDLVAALCTLLVIALWKWV